MSRHGNNRHVLPRRFLCLADRVGGFDSTQLRHLDIHQDSIEASNARSRQGSLPVFSRDGPVTTFLEQFEDQLLVDGIVFSHEDAERLPDLWHSVRDVR